MNTNNRYERYERYETGFYGREESSSYERIANGLGWFSIGLGLAEVVAPGAVANLIGINDDSGRRNMLRSPLYGMRELAAGAGILSQSQPAPWLWGRVAGDLFDLSSLATAYANEQNDRKRVAMGIAAVVGVTVLDVLCAKALSGEQYQSSRQSSQPETTQVILINKPPEEVYGFWHNYENLPRFMKHLQSVQSIGDRRTRWVANGPAGKTIQWEAETVEDQPNRMIAWRSAEGSEIYNSGAVNFEQAPGGRGTIVRVDLQYDPPGGRFGAMVAKLFGKDAGQMLYDDLRAFKQIMEVGEVVNSDASIHTGMHAAQPPYPNEPTLEQQRGQSAGGYEAGRYQSEQNTGKRREREYA